MDSFFLQLKKLYDNELFSNVLPIACIIENAYDRDRSLLTPEQYFLMHMYNANSLFHERHYRKAEMVYRKALQARKMLIKAKNATPYTNNYENLTEMFPESEVCFKLAQCLDATKQLVEAANVLHSIPKQQRTVKVNMLLGKLSQQTGRHNHAQSAFRMVLTECPFNLEAIKWLMLLGMKDCDIETVISGSNLPAQCTEWLSSWIDAYTSMHRCRFADAVEKLRAIESKSQFANNEIFQVLIGQCCYYNGDCDMALEYLTRAHTTNPHMLDGLMTLAAVYALKGQTDELERMTLPTMSVTEFTSEHWFVWAQLFFKQGKYEKASYFAHKACFMNSKNVEATLLKARVFLELKKYAEAVIQFKAMLEFAGYRFELYDGLVTCYINMQRLREARNISNDAVLRLGKTARTYVLVSRVLLADPEMRPKAKIVLEKAMELNKNYMPAILLLVELLLDEENAEEAIKLMKRVILVQPTSNLMSMLADIYMSTNEPMHAVEYYTKALNLDPSNKKATEGLLSLEQAANNKVPAFEESMAVSDGVEYEMLPGMDA